MTASQVAVRKQFNSLLNQGNNVFFHCPTHLSLIKISLWQMLKIQSWQVLILNPNATIWSSFLIYVLEGWPLEYGRRKVFSMKNLGQLRYQHLKEMQKSSTACPWWLSWVTSFFCDIVARRWIENALLEGGLGVSSVQNYCYLVFYNSKVSGSPCNFWLFKFLSQN